MVSFFKTKSDQNIHQNAPNNGYFAPRDTLKNMLYSYSFYHILHKNSIAHLLRTSRDSFRPPPKKSFRNEMDNTLFYFYVGSYFFE